MNLHRDRERSKRLIGKMSSVLVNVKGHAFNVKSIGTIALARTRQWLDWRSESRREKS